MEISFSSSFKRAFKKRIKDNTYLDETEYLLKSTVNKNRLMRAIENVKERQNLVEVSLQDLP